MNVNVFKLVLNTVKSGSIITNLALSGYLFFLNEMVYDWFFYDTVHEISSDIFYNGGTNPFLGVILFLAMAGELAAFILKSRYGGEAGSEGVGVFLLWMFHTVIAVLMTIVALGAFGITFENEKYIGILSAALFASVIKELVILVIIIGGTEKRRPSKLKNFIADMLFLIFYSLAYTIVIGNLLKTHDYNNYLLASHYSIPLIVMYTFIVILLFFMLYLPLRIPYFLYERYGSTKELVIGGLSILFVAAAVVLPLFEGEYSLERALEHPGDVEILFLNSTGIDEVPVEIRRFNNLRVLHLGFNRIRALPLWLAELDKLEWIGLGGNSFRALPPVLLELPRLKEIDIHYNRIKKMPHDLSPLKRLRLLNIRSNSMPPAEKERVMRVLQRSEKNPGGITLIL